MIPIARPLIGVKEKQAVLAVLESGMLAQGAQVRGFEETFAEYCGVKYAVATSSGTTALHLALLAHGIGPGDEVITSPFSFVATANAILYVGARPMFADIESDTFNLDPEQVARQITPRTKAIIPVHLFGHSVDMARFLDIAQRYNLILIEDACQAHGAEFQGRRVGTFGTGCFSFYPTKNMTSAEGGMVTTNDLAIADGVRLLRNHGMHQRYYHETLGYNFRMTDLHAAIGLAQLSQLDDFTAKRRANAAYFNAHLTSVITPVVRPGCGHVWHQYTVRVKGDRDAAVKRLNDAGIGTGVYYPVPIHKQAYMREIVGNVVMPVAERLAQEVISLPVHPQLSQADLEIIVTEVNRL